MGVKAKFEENLRVRKQEMQLYDLKMPYMVLINYKLYKELKRISQEAGRNMEDLIYESLESVLNKYGNNGHMEK